jgi:hypothetical protein
MSWAASSRWPGWSWAAGGSVQGEPVPDVPSLARFRGWDELLEEAGEARDPELRFLVQLVVHYGRALPGLVADLRRRAAPHPAAAERVLSTAHKAKGLEWERVRLAGDFPGLGELDALDRDGLPWLTPRSATRSCTCSTSPRPAPGEGWSPTPRSGAASRHERNGPPQGQVRRLALSKGSGGQRRKRLGSRLASRPRPLGRPSA